METGIVQFGNDWPGVFIRGDNAFSYKQHLDVIIKWTEAGDIHGDAAISLEILKGLSGLLGDSDVRNIRKDGGAA